MSAKSDLQVLVQASVDAAAAVKVAVDALPESDPALADLQKKIDDLSTQLASAKAALVSEDAALQADEAKISKLKEILLA